MRIFTDVLDYIITRWLVDVPETQADPSLFRIISAV